VFSVLGGLLLAAAGIMPLRDPPSKLSDVTRLVPIIACTAATMYCGNTAYLHLSVSFIQILKAFTPALTLMIGAAAGVEQLKVSLVASVLLIAIGTGWVVPSRMLQVYMLTTTDYMGRVLLVVHKGMCSALECG
jgi:drug/metabolite transporter (DMT)-like permease